jgi:hypothetical protein
MPPPSHYAHLDLHLIIELILVGKDKELGNLEKKNHFGDEKEDGHIFNLTTCL